MSMDSVSSGLPEKSHHFVIFMLERQTYALVIDPLIKIGKIRSVTPVSRDLRCIVGTSTAFGMTVPMIDLRCHLGLPETGLGFDAEVLFVKAGEQIFGLIVDRVIAVLGLSTGEGKQPDPIYPGTVIETAYGHAVLLDFEHLFSLDELLFLPFRTVQPVRPLLAGRASRPSQN